MSDEASHFYTAAQLAQAAAVSKKVILAGLRNVPPVATVIMRGNPTSAWTIESLSEHHRKEIERRAVATGCRDAHALITGSPVAPWQPPIPLNEIAHEAITKAEKLRQAMARIIEERDNPDLTSAALEAMGQADYHRIFGHAVTTRTIRALLKRTVERDNFADNFSRLEIYLDANCPRKASISTTAILHDAGDFQELHNLLATFKSAAAPSPMERERLWSLVFELHQRLVESGHVEKLAKKRLINFLWRCAPWLAKTKNALRVAFADRYWRIEEGRGQADGRREKRGVPTAPPIPPALVDLVVFHAAFRSGGRISQACREQREVLEGTADPELQIMADALEEDPAIARLLEHNSANKSYVNARLREAVRYDVSLMEKYRLGGRTLNSARAALERYYEGIPSGFCMSSDDVTLPVWWYVPDGQGWFNLVRGQCLIVIDKRTLCILGFSLQPDRNYTSPVIHTIFTKVFAQWGVPQKLYLECGIWKNSKLITGSPRRETNHPDYRFMPYSWAETEAGLGRLGIQFHHAIRPRSKVVERVIGMVQDLMEGEPGYSGREERHDLPEKIKVQMEDVKYHRAHPAKYFYDGDQWEARLVVLFEKYNRTIQQGKILAGMSPMEAQEKLQSPILEKRPKLFDAAHRHLLAHYHVQKEAGQDGVTITIGGKKWTYRDAQLSRDRYKQKICGFNPDDPSVLVVTDLNMKNPYLVELSKPVAALDPDPAAFAAEMKRIEDYESYGKTRYRVLSAKFNTMFQPLATNRATIETGMEIRQQREIIDERRQRTVTRVRKIQRRGSVLGLDNSILHTGPDGDEGTAMMLEAKRNRLNQKENSTTTE